MEERRYESDPADKADINLQRAPLSNPFSQGGNWFRRTVNRREGEPYFKPRGRTPLSDTKHTVTLDNGHVIRKTFNKIQPSAPRTFSAIPNSLINNNDLAGKRKKLPLKETRFKCRRPFNELHTNGRKDKQEEENQHHEHERFKIRL